MHRTILPLTALVLVLLATGPSHGQDDAGVPLGEEVAALRAEVELLRTELDETRALLDETVDWIHRRADAASDMQQVLEASEEAGFTFGINPRSRELLLEGWRKQLSARQEKLPGAKAPAPQKGEAPARGGFQRG